MLSVAKMFNVIRITLALLSPTFSMLVEQHYEELEELMSRLLQFISNGGEEPQLEYLYLYSDKPSFDDSCLPSIEKEERGDNDVVVVRNHI